MSRSIHSTPGFPRALRGPRGGRHIAPTPCVVCVSFTSCRPGTCSAPFGCESWVDEDGRRVDLLADLDREAVDLDALDTPDPDDPGPYTPKTAEQIDASIDGRGPDPTDFDDKDPNPYAPSPATLSEMSGIFPTDDNAPDPDPEPGGGRFTFEAMGGLVKGKCGTTDLIEAALPAVAAVLDADRPGSIAHRLIELNDPGPLFGGLESNGRRSRP